MQGAARREGSEPVARSAGQSTALAGEDGPPRMAGLGVVSGSTLRQDATNTGLSKRTPHGGFPRPPFGRARKRALASVPPLVVFAIQLRDGASRPDACGLADTQLSVGCTTLVLKHPEILSTAALAGIDNKAAAAQGHPAEGTRDDSCFRAV